MKLLACLPPMTLLIFYSLSLAQINPAQYVNPFVGTDGHGHTFPGATVPFGMVQLSPDTRVEGWDACAGYHYSDSTLLGFSHTHLSGTGVADYGDILFLPTTGNPGLKSRTRFTHTEESASPGYYKVRLPDENIIVELTTTKRVGVHRYTFPKTREAFVLIDLKHGLGPDRVLESWLEFTGDREVVGYRRSEGWAKDQHIYFVAKFSKPFSEYGSISPKGERSARRIHGTTVRGFVQFSRSAGEPIMIKVGISAVSIDGARKNLDAEMPHWDFAKAKHEAGQAWNKELRKIEVDGGTEEQRRTFYTALYHVMIAPNLFNDVDGNYRTMDGKIKTARGFNMYTVFSLWDTFRAEHPLLAIIDRGRTLDFVKSLLEKYDESNILPVWELCANETWTMIGYHAVPVIVDAYAKGIRDFDAEKAFRAMKASAMQDHYGLKFYREHGFIPGERESESVSKTLEYSFDDWCIAQMANMLDKQDEFERFSERAQFYKNVFDHSTGLMRGKRNGGWVDPFDPAAVTVFYTEANAWQYSFFVPHDIPGLIREHGSKENLRKKLDELFLGSPAMTGRQQVDITGMIGQYAHGNEPSHHVAYMHNYVDEPWNTQRIVRRVLDSLYTDQPDGLCGNDDCGQLSAWYVLSALGFYPVTPGLPTYAIGSPLFNKITIHLENGKDFIVKGPRNSKENKYVQKIFLNGKQHRRFSLEHDDIVRGGVMEFEMGSHPNKNTWSEDKIAPTNNTPIVAVPFLNTSAQSFRESLAVQLKTNTEGADILYSLSPEISGFVRYQHPFVMTETCTLKTYAVKQGMIPSRTAAAVFEKRTAVGTLLLNSSYSSQYTGGGKDALVDGVRGGSDFRLGNWQGYEQEDLDAMVDLGEEKRIEELTLGCLQDNNSWIFFPTRVEFYFSDDGRNYFDSTKVTTDVPPEDPRILVKDFGTLANCTARFVRVKAQNLGHCPPWHKGGGAKAWLFVDELIIKTK